MASRNFPQKSAMDFVLPPTPPLRSILRVGSKIRVKWADEGPNPRRLVQVRVFETIAGEKEKVWDEEEEESEEEEEEESDQEADEAEEQDQEDEEDMEAGHDEEFIGGFKLLILLI